MHDTSRLGVVGSEYIYAYYTMVNIYLVELETKKVENDEETYVDVLIYMYFNLFSLSSNEPHKSYQV